jgi:ParB/Sulfiredoxin domain
MRINTRGQERPDRRQGSKGQRMPSDCACTSRCELEGTTVRVQALSINQIKLNRRNSRTHSGRQIRQIANSIVAFGFTNPLLITEDGTLIAGEGRYKAAQLLGLANVPVIVLAGLSPARQRALAIADNKIAENAGWNRERLAIEIPELAGLLETEGLDVSIRRAYKETCRTLAISIACSHNGVAAAAPCLRCPTFPPPTKPVSKASSSRSGTACSRRVARPPRSCKGFPRRSSAR